MKSEILEDHLWKWSIVYVVGTYLAGIALRVPLQPFVLMTLIGFIYLVILDAFATYDKFKVKCELSKSLKNKDL